MKKKKKKEGNIIRQLDTITGLIVGGFLMWVEASLELWVLVFFILFLWYLMEENEKLHKIIEKKKQ